MDATRGNSIQQRRRLYRVMEHIGRELDGRSTAEALSLRTLANVACWSPEHFDRVYRQAIGEPPMATLRRLRLQQAARSLAAGLPLLVVAQRAGYGSTQAFSRAFAREHGASPGAWLRQPRGMSPAQPFSIIRLDQAVPCHMLAYRGDASGVSSVFDTVVDRLQRSGSPRRQWRVFGVAPADASLGAWGRVGGLCEMQAVVMAPPLVASPRGMDTWTLRAGTYARIAATQACNKSWDELLAGAGWQRTDAPVVRRYVTDPAYTAPQERREWLYLPLVRR
ncbi:MAG TPA: AraC family transcriptional regulator [Terriglobales bacterium]|nr:AraC family transcriptional regulator [Terriglobales bacterium]